MRASDTLGTGESLDQPDSRSLCRLADDYRLGRHADFRPPRVHAHGGRRGYLGGDGLRAAFRQSRRQYGRAVQRQFAQGRTDAGGGEDLAWLGPVDHRQGRPRDRPILASDRLGEPELAHARDFLPADDGVGLGVRAVLRRAGPLEIRHLHPGGGGPVLHGETLRREPGSGGRSPSVSPCSSAGRSSTSGRRGSRICSWRS